MDPIIRSFEGVPHEAVCWYRSERGANKEAKCFEINGFSTHVTFEDWWSGWFVWVSILGTA